MEIFKLFGTIGLKGVPEAKKDIGDVGKTAKDTGEETTTAFGKIGKAVKSAFENKNVNAFGQSLEKVTYRVQGQQDRLDLLKKKYKDLYLQFGENSEEAKECAAEIEKLSKELKENKAALDDAEKAADKFDKTIDDVADSSDDAGEKVSSSFSKIGGAIGKASLAVGGACVAIGSAILTVTENTREYRAEMAKLDTAFLTAGHSTESARKAYSELNSILGETDQAVEAANHLAKLTDNEKDLMTWTNICTGVYATFGASLPIEGLTEAANETAKVGQVTGSLADALNWAGVSEDAFNAQLASCSTEQERQRLIMETLNGLYSDASEEYKKANADVIAHEKAQQRLNDVLAKFGEVGEPIITFFTNAIAGLAEKAVPAVEKIGDGFTNLQTKLQNTNFDDFKTKIAGLIPESMLPRIEEFKENIAGIFSNIKADAIADFQSKLEPLQNMFTKIQEALQPVVEVYLVAFMNYLETGASVFETVVMPAISLLVTGIIDLVTAISEKCQPAIEKMSEIYTKAFDTMKNLWFDTLKPVFDEFIQMATELYTENKDKIDKIGELFGTVFNAIASVISWFYETIIEGGLIPVIQWLSDFVSQNMDIIKQSFQVAFDMIGGIIDFFIALFKGDWEGMWEAIKTVLSSAIENLKLQFQIAQNFILSIWNSIKQKLAEIILNIIKGVVEKFERMKYNVEMTVGKIKTAVANKIVSMKENVLGVFDKLKDGIKTRIESAKTIVSNVAEAMKKLFNWEFKIPKIKLPHFSISPSGWKVGDLLEGVKPTLGIEWYKEGGVMEEPTVFGRNGNNLMVGGEAGAEAIAPIDVLQDYVRQAVAEANANDGTNKMIELLQQQNELLLSLLNKDSSILLDGRELGRAVNKYA